MNNCYLCNSSSFIDRKGQVRDNLNIKAVECIYCGLVTLSSFNHIQDGFYENSGMHEDKLMSMDAWLKVTNWDDQRRFDMLRTILPNNKLLDFGCGAGGFLVKAKELAGLAEGVELELRVKKHWHNILTIHPNLEFVTEKYDIITSFHVIEHLPDPSAALKILSEKLTRNGRIIIEVPSSEDCLLSLYNSEAFQKFTYWSQHLFLFNPETLAKLVKKSGLRILSIQQYQRYPLSNHLYWLSQKKAGGHNEWNFFNTPELNNAYSNVLASLGKCDTLIAYLELDI